MTSPVTPADTARHLRRLAERRAAEGRSRACRLRAEIRFDRDAFAKRIEELVGLSLSSGNKAQNALAANAED